MLLDSISVLKSGSDLRGTYADDTPTSSSGVAIANVIQSLQGRNEVALLTPFAAHCLGAAFARWTHLHKRLSKGKEYSNDEPLTICVGRDPRPHGELLAAAFARGVTGTGTKDGGGNISVVVSYTGIATTPSMYEFVRAEKCDAAMMITASHLPEEKNGMKFFADDGGLSKSDVDELIRLAHEEVRMWYDRGIIPPCSLANESIQCTKQVDYMPYYGEALMSVIIREVGSSSKQPLSNLKIVVNPGKGSGCFFSDILRDLGADVSGSIHLIPDGTFPQSFGVPNPEKKAMVDETLRACEANGADIGIMFDTDADRAGFVLPRVIHEDGTKTNYEPLNRNRLIALLGVVFATSSPGCTIVTDSTTSEGLNAFLEGNLGLRHFRYIRGYANVIQKAKEITASGVANAEVAIETSGHCAMKENGYVDDGTYTAVKVIGLLARTTLSGQDRPLLDLISELNELPFDEEFRIKVTDSSLTTTTSIFEQVTKSLTERCNVADDWSLDEDNLEGVRVRLSSGGFFMIRQSLHDPVMSIQVESTTREEATEKVLKPLLDLLSQHEALDCSALLQVINHLGD